MPGIVPSACQGIVVSLFLQFLNSWETITSLIYSMKIVWLLAVFIMKVTSDELYTNTYAPSEESGTFKPDDVNNDLTSDKPAMQGKGSAKFPNYKRNIHMANYSKYAGLVIFVIGITGNTLSLLVFCRPAFRKSTTGLLFRLLSITDTAALHCFAVPDVIEKFTGGTAFGSDTACKVIFSLYHSLYRW